MSVDSTDTKLVQEHNAEIRRRRLRVTTWGFWHVTRATVGSHTHQGDLYTTIDEEGKVTHELRRSSP